MAIFNSYVSHYQRVSWVSPTGTLASLPPPRCPAARPPCPVGPQFVGPGQPQLVGQPPVARGNAGTHRQGGPPTAALRIKSVWSVPTREVVDVLGFDFGGLGGQRVICAHWKRVICAHCKRVIRAQWNRVIRAQRAVIRAHCLVEGEGTLNLHHYLTQAFRVWLGGGNIELTSLLDSGI